MRNTILGLSIICLVASCMPKELPAPAHEQGDTEIGTVEMGEDYGLQIYYSLADNKIVAAHSKTIWDLAFETGSDGFHVLLNGSKFMMAYNTGEKDFNAVTDTTGLGNGGTYDLFDRHFEATAIGDWRTEKPVYIIDRGRTASGNAIGYLKLQIQEVTETTYQLVFQDLKDASPKTITLTKNDDYSFTYLSFDEGGKEVKVAPPKEEWDLCFTQFTVQIPIPYLVTGVLLNPYQTQAAMDDVISFEEIDLTFATQLSLSDSLNAIGFGWKDYDFDVGAYTVFPEKNYIIKTSNATYFKLHFIDFYSNQGVKGSPKWELQRL